MTAEGVQTFQPDAIFAYRAQQDEITALREELAETRKRMGDRNIYLQALALQLQEEANTEIARLHGEISLLRGQPEDALPQHEHDDSMVVDPDVGAVPAQQE